MAEQVRPQKNIERAALIELILENAGDILWAYDFRKERYTYASPSVFDLRGFTQDEIEQQSLYDALTVDSAAKAKTLLEEHLKRIESGDMTARLGINDFEQVRKDGSTVMTEVMTTFITNNGGKVTGIVGITRDITKRLDEEHCQNELEKKLYEAQKLESINRIVNGIAHELNNKLTPVSGYSQLLSELCHNDKESLEYCHQIYQSAHNASLLIDQLLDYTGSQYLQLENFDLHQAIVDIEHFLRSVIHEKIHLKRQHDGSCPCVKMDFEKLRQIVLSLAFNAQDAMPDGGTMTIEIKTVTLEKSVAVQCEMHEGDYAQLTISDTGTGISPSVMPKIFDPFFTTKDFGMASGLGLSAIYGIVKQHSGNIEVNSTVHEGTSVRILFPLHENELPASLNAERETTPDEKSQKTISEDQVWI